MKNTIILYVQSNRSHKSGKEDKGETNQDLSVAQIQAKGKDSIKKNVVMLGQSKHGRSSAIGNERGAPSVPSQIATFTTNSSDISQARQNTVEPSSIIGNQVSKTSKKDNEASAGSIDLVTCHSQLTIESQSVDNQTMGADDVHRALTNGDTTLYSVKGNDRSDVDRGLTEIAEVEQSQAISENGRSIPNISEDTRSIPNASGNVRVFTEYFRSCTKYPEYFRSCTKYPEYFRSCARYPEYFR